MSPLQFQPLASQPTPAFWSALTALKLDKLKLDDSPHPITAWLEQGRTIADTATSSLETPHSGNVGLQGSVILDGSAFGDATEGRPPDTIPMHGTIKNFNTIEEFRQTEAKKKLFDQVADSMIASFSSSAPILNPFVLVTFADLKKYIYHYWFAFPAVVTKPAWELVGSGLEDVSAADINEIRQLEASMWQARGNYEPAFLVRGSPGQRSVAPISFYPEFSKGVSPGKIAVAFHDPSSLPNNPGWPLRNVLHYLKERHAVTSLTILCLRGEQASRQGTVTTVVAEFRTPLLSQLQVVGWERDQSGRLSSRTVDLGPLMDPERLAEQAVDLNLKLMRWRIMPSLDLDGIAKTKCLLLGAGTLGCYVARALMGWGIRNITFVDSGHVSYSNPVRQPLFEFEDCLNGGRAKAPCAAERLKKIFPAVNTKGFSFSIPMPGHPVQPSREKEVEGDISLLQELIRSHDAVFLLMDSRESRWLPTLIGAAENKLVINVALAFDGYLVMRHGGRTPTATGESLGCYFCNDVVAPTDSLTDRTLDQMCTVTRPGVAPIASALAVELLISLIQHPLGIDASAEISSIEYSGESVGRDADVVSPLGSVPHQLRGTVREWRTLVLKGASFDKCTGCSSTIVNAYSKGSFPFLMKAFNEPSFLERMTGLDSLQAESEALLDSLEWTSSDDED